jgi:hypothetical protein
MNEQMNYKGYTIDPIEGWKYGFPKECKEDCYNIFSWLLENGYPGIKLVGGETCPIRVFKPLENIDFEYTVVPEGTIEINKNEHE